MRVLVQSLQKKNTIQYNWLEDTLQSGRRLEHV